MNEIECLLDEMTAKGVELGAIDFWIDGNGTRVVLKAASGREVMMGIDCGDESGNDRCEFVIWTQLQGADAGAQRIWCAFELKDPSSIARIEEHLRSALQ